MSAAVHLNDDLYLAVCRSLSHVELTGNADADFDAQVSAARDSLYALARWFHTKQHAFGLLVRLSDKRVLATTCDHESMTSDGNGPFDDASKLSSAVASLTGERLSARSRTTELLCHATTTNGDAERWFEERTRTLFVVVVGRRRRWARVSFALLLCSRPCPWAVSLFCQQPQFDASCCVRRSALLN